MSKKRYHDLVVWREAHGFVLSIYKNSENFPKDELFGVTSQLRRAAVSIPNNIVEGTTKSSVKDQLRFCEIALGSLNECAYLLELARDLHYLTPDVYRELDDHQTRTEYLLLKFMNSKGRRFSKPLPATPS